jgi:hypothetical protein
MTTLMDTPALRQRQATLLEKVFGTLRASSEGFTQK